MVGSDEATGGSPSMPKLKRRSPWSDTCVTADMLLTNRSTPVVAVRCLRRSLATPLVALVAPLDGPLGDVGDVGDKPAPSSDSDMAT